MKVDHLALDVHQDIDLLDLSEQQDVKGPVNIGMNTSMFDLLCIQTDFFFKLDMGKLKDRLATYACNPEGDMPPPSRSTMYTNRVLFSNWTWVNEKIYACNPEGDMPPPSTSPLEATLALKSRQYGSPRFSRHR